VTVAARFDAATAVRRAGRGSYDAVCDTAWSAPNGPNGGYLAAIVLRAITAEVDDPARHARSLTCHYLRPPTDGPVHVDVAVERAGRNVSAVSARLSQRGRVCVIALAALGIDLPSADAYATPAPDAPPPETVPPQPALPGAPPMADRVEARPVFGGPPLAGVAEEALTGGWLRLADPVEPDEATLAFYTDAWLPAPFPRLREPVAAPTLDLTIHFRAPGALAALAPDTPVLARFRSTTSAAGFFEEDGEVWAPDGTLLAQSRQLALLVPMRREAAA
jgi:acyl-CoA thioesterase